MLVIELEGNIKKCKEKSLLKHMNEYLKQRMN